MIVRTGSSSRSPTIPNKGAEAAGQAGSELSPPVRDGRRRSAAWWVGAGIFLSRISGLVRDAALAYYLGSSRAFEVVAAGLRTPNVLQNLLGEGTLSASFIPVYARMLEEGREEEAGELAGAILGLLAIVAYGAALVGVLAAPLLGTLLFPEWDDASRELFTRILRVLFPMTATLALSAWSLGVLNSHRRFFLSYVAPVVWNGAIVVALVVAGGAYLGGESAIDAVVVAFAWGALAGAGLQLGVQLPTVARLLRGFRLSLGRGVAGVPDALRAFGPVVAARGVVNLSAWVDLFLAGLLVQGAVAHLSRAQMLYVLPISLFAMSIAASELPELARSTTDSARSLAEPVRRALARARFFLLPSAVAYLVFGDALVAALLQRGDFGAQDSIIVGFVLAAYAVGLPASGASRTLSSAFYALSDTRTPAIVASVRVVIAIGIGASLMFPLDGYSVGPFGAGAVGLALGSALAAWVEYLWLRSALSRRIGAHGPGVGGLGRLVAACVLAALAAVGARAGVTAAGADPLAIGVGTAAAFGFVYLAAAAGMGEGGALRGLRAK